MKLVVSFLLRPKNLRAIGEDAISQMQEQVNGMRNQLNDLLADALLAGETISEMKSTLQKGKESGKSLDNFIKEVQDRLGRN